MKNGQFCTPFYSNVFFYYHLYRNSLFRNIIVNSGIKLEDDDV